MKTIQSIAAICLMAFATLFMSCSSDDGGGGGGKGVSAKIDGSGFSSYVAQAMSVQGMLVIQSSDKQGRSIQIQIPNFAGVGTYTSGNNNLANGYIQYTTAVNMNNPLDVDAYTSVRGTGTVEITEVTETGVKGTFTATAILNEDGSNEDVAITNGKINVEFASN